MNTFHLTQQVFRNCKAIYVDGSEKKGSSKAKIKVNDSINVSIIFHSIKIFLKSMLIYGINITQVIYGSFLWILRVGVWVLELPLKVEVGDDRLNVVAGWKVPLINDPIFWLLQSLFMAL